MPTFSPSSVSSLSYTATALLPTTAVNSFSNVYDGGDYGASGPWMIEEQAMTVQYWRVPRITPSGLHLNLSDCSQSLNVAYTDLWVQANAMYSRTYTTDIYVSAIQTRTQLFELQSNNTDQEGVTYNADAPNGTNLPASALGVRGSIYTSRPWYNRRPWLSATDSTTHQFNASQAYNFRIAGLGGKTEDEIFGNDYAWWSPTTNPLGVEGAQMITNMPGGSINGNYDPDNDYLRGAFLPQILDLIGTKIAAGTLTSYTAESGRRVPGYRKDRHDYTNTP